MELIGNRSGLAAIAEAVAAEALFAADTEAAGIIAITTGSACSRSPPEPTPSSSTRSSWKLSRNSSRSSAAPTTR
jgi:hypothetical protein